MKEVEDMKVVCLNVLNVPSAMEYLPRWIYLKCIRKKNIELRFMKKSYSLEISLVCAMYSVNSLCTVFHRQISSNSYMLHFKNFQAVEGKNWKRNVIFLRNQTTSSTDGINWTYFLYHRSGYFQSEPKGNQKIKSQGSNKINRPVHRQWYEISLLIQNHTIA